MSPKFLALEPQLLLNNDVIEVNKPTTLTDDGVSRHSKGMYMIFIIRALIKLGILRNDFDYHLLRASMVIIFLYFGYQKWFEYEAQALLPYIGHGPLLIWMYPVFGVRGATYFLGVAEWLFAALLFAGYWNKKLGILGALGSCFSFVATTTIRFWMPHSFAQFQMQREDARLDPARRRPVIVGVNVGQDSRGRKTTHGDAEDSSGNAGPRPSSAAACSALVFAEFRADHLNLRGKTGLQFVCRADEAPRMQRSLLKLSILIRTNDARQLSQESMSVVRNSA